MDCNHEAWNAERADPDYHGCRRGGGARLLAGAVITETVFSYPGLGYLTIQSIQGLDYPVVEAALILGAGIFLVLTCLIDLSYGLIDPRVRLAAR